MPFFTFQESTLQNSTIVDPKGLKRRVKAKNIAGARSRLPRSLIRGWCLVNTEPDPNLPEELAPATSVIGQFRLALGLHGVIPLTNTTGQKVGSGVIDKNGELCGTVDMTTPAGRQFYRNLQTSPSLFSLAMTIEQSRVFPKED